MRSFAIRTCVLIAAMFATSVNATELVRNGDFSGGLAGWTSYLTANGTISPTRPKQGGLSPTDSSAKTQIFDVSGTTPSAALWLNAGQYLPPYGTANPAGGGIVQIFNAAAGTVSFTADIAAMTRFNGDTGGAFSVLLDGREFDSFDFGAISGVTRATLDFTASLAAGEHRLALQVVRPYAPAVGLRSQYFDNVSLNQVAAVPEPANWAMMLIGFGVAGYALRRRKGQRGFLSAV